MSGGWAGAEEIYLTDSVYDAPGVADFLQHASLHQQAAKLEGVAERGTVLKIERE